MNTSNFHPYVQNQYDDEVYYGAWEWGTIIYKNVIIFTSVSAGVLSDSQIDKNTMDRELNENVFFPIEFPEINWIYMDTDSPLK